MNTTRTQDMIARDDEDPVDTALELSGYDTSILPEPDRTIAQALADRVPDMFFESKIRIEVWENGLWVDRVTPARALEMEDEQRRDGVGACDFRLEGGEILDRRLLAELVALPDGGR